MAYSIQKDSYLGIPKCYGVLSKENIDVSGILPLQNDRTLSLTGQGVLIVIFDVEEEHGKMLQQIAKEAAPQAKVELVLLEDASNELKEFYFIPRGKIVASEEEILNKLDRYQDYEGPLVICMPLGCNNGGHSGDSPLCAKLNQYSLRTHGVAVVATGNEAVNRHHYKGRSTSLLNPVQVEIYVAEDMEGFYLEVWSLPPERVEVTLQSPTGEVTPKGTGQSSESITYTFLFEQTRAVIDYRDVGVTNREELIFIRLERPVAGIWTLNVYPQYVLEGNFHIWLPMKEMLEKDVVFLEPNPEVTLTQPSDAQSVLTVGGYDARTSAVFLESGRGYDTSGVVKPEMVAPCKENAMAGTSIAAAITAGACAQVLEWGVVKKNAIYINGIDIKNFLIRGCKRQKEKVYPNPIEGYGRLNVFEAFLQLK